MMTVKLFIFLSSQVWTALNEACIIESTPKFYLDTRIMFFDKNLKKSMATSKFQRWETLNNCDIKSLTREYETHWQVGANMLTSQFSGAIASQTLTKLSRRFSI